VEGVYTLSVKKFIGKMMIELSKAQTSLHPWIGSNPIQNIQFLQAEEYKLNLISKIFFSSIAVISLAVIASSFIFSSVSLAIVLPLTCSVITTPFLAWGSSQFQEECLKVRQIIERELPVAKTYERIKNYSDEEIEKFLTKNDIPIPASIDLKNLLPVIARFLARQEQSRICFEIGKKNLKSVHISNKEMRLYQRNFGWDIIETKAIPLAIEGAFALQILKNPTLQGTLSSHFNLLHKSFTERQFDQIFGPKDPYLTFLKINKEPLDLEVFIKYTDLKKINELLFENNN
jgi:hypothetical protein